MKSEYCQIKNGLGPFSQENTGTLPSVCFLALEWGIDFPIDDHDYGVNGIDYNIELYFYTCSII